MLTDWPVEVDQLYGCWLWHGHKDKTSGYGTHWVANRAYKAHRAVYEAEVGPIPEGLALDHLCRRRLCVNPAHLEPVKQSVNERRKLWRNRTKQKRCKLGHDLHRHGRLTPAGGKVCRICNGEDREP